MNDREFFLQVCGLTCFGGSAARRCGCESAVACRARQRPGFAEARQAAVRRFSRLLRLVVIAGLLSGCARPPDSYRVTISPELSPEQVGYVLGAEDSWMASVPVTWTNQVAPCDGQHLGQGEVCVRFGPTVGQDFGDTIPEQQWGRPGWGGDVRLRRDLDLADGLFRVTVAHELGHAMGLPHLRAGTLMAAHRQDAATDVTDLDAAAWEALR